MSEPPLLLAEREEGVLVLTLNRPRVRNAVVQRMSDLVAESLELLDAEPELRVGVLTGAGKGFCAGMDLRELQRTGRRPVAGDRGFGGITRRAARKPLIAAVEGFALGGGFEIALACDLIVASRGALLGIPEVKRSLIAACGGLRQLPRRLPAALAMELALTGEPLAAERGYELGLVNRLSEPGGALAAALELAGAIAANGPLAVQASKRVLDGQWSWTDGEYFERQDEVYRPVMSSEDAREGVLAFTEKREPRWSGR
jgi:enoyl-CoA hydratase/carnithine racemase